MTEVRLWADGNRDTDPLAVLKLEDLGLESPPNRLVVPSELGLVSVYKLKYRYIPSRIHPSEKPSADYEFHHLADSDG